MSRLRKLALGLLVSAVLLAGLEAAARLLTGAPTPPFVAQIPAPGESGQWLTRDAAGQVVAHFQKTFQIPPFPAAPGARPRVIWVGGSSVRGGRGDSQVSSEMAGVSDRYVGGLEMLNLGAPGVDTRHLWAMLPELLALQPQVLVVYSGHNDLGNVLFEDSVPSLGAARVLRVRAVLRHLRIFELMERSQERAALLGDDADRSRLQAMAPSQRAAVLAGYEQRLRWIVRAARSQGVQVMLLSVVSDARAPAAEWRCPERMVEAGFGPSPADHMPGQIDVALLEDSDCPDAQWFLALETSRTDPEQAAETLLSLRDTDPWATRAGRPSNAILRQVAADEGAVFVDVAEQAQALGGGIEPMDWFTDSIHLSKPGHRGIARVVAPELAALLERPLQGKEDMERESKAAPKRRRGPSGPHSAPGGPGPGPRRPPGQPRAGGGSPGPASD